MGDIVHELGQFFQCSVTLVNNIKPTSTTGWELSWNKIPLIRILPKTGDTAITAALALNTEDLVSWLPMQAIKTSGFEQALQDASLLAGENRDTGFVNYEYETMDKIEDPFTVFNIKVEIKARNPANVAKIKNFKAIATL
jgi:hypothetical protein